jgi:hypothetical protein
MHGAKVMIDLELTRIKETLRKLILEKDISFNV